MVNHEDQEEEDEEGDDQAVTSAGSLPMERPMAKVEASGRRRTSRERRARERAARRQQSFKDTVLARIAQRFSRPSRDEEEPVTEI